MPKKDSSERQGTKAKLSKIMQMMNGMKERKGKGHCKACRTGRGKCTCGNEEDDEGEYDDDDDED